MNDFWMRLCQRANGSFKRYDVKCKEERMRKYAKFFFVAKQVKEQGTWMQKLMLWITQKSRAYLYNNYKPDEQF